MLQNSSNIVQIFQNHQDELKEYLLVTADVQSLYTSMACWQGTLHALCSFLNEYRREKTDLIFDLVSFVLKNNFFLYDEVVYHQLSGMAMGTPMAMNVANIFSFCSRKNHNIYFQAFHNVIRSIRRRPSACYSSVTDLLSTRDKAASLFQIERNSFGLDRSGKEL